MAWPAHKPSGFYIGSTEWNEVVDAFPSWGGDANAGGHSLANLDNLYVGTLNPRSGNFVTLAGGLARTRVEQDPTSLRANNSNLNLQGTAGGFALCSSEWINTLPSFSSGGFDVICREIALRHGGLGGAGTGHITTGVCLSLSMQTFGGAVIDNGRALFIGGVAASTAHSIFDVSGAQVYLSGKVGIGTTNPYSRFHLAHRGVPGLPGAIIGDNPYLNTSNQAGIGMDANTDGNVYIDVKAVTAGSVYFRSGCGAEFGYARVWMVVNPSNGKVGIGTSPSISGTGKFHHSGDTCRILDSANAPGNSAAAGNMGEIRISTPYLYFHDGTDWRRVTGATF